MNYCHVHIQLVTALEGMNTEREERERGRGRDRAECTGVCGQLVCMSLPSPRPELH